jgi:Endodeoxyribonuclease RusA
MSVRKRQWQHNGAAREAWVVDFVDTNNRRRLRTFKTLDDAKKFSGVVTAIRNGIVPDAITPRSLPPLAFTVGLPSSFRGANRGALVADLRAACGLREPVLGNVVLHLVAEMPPRSTIADVDNVLKPVLDALTGFAWIDDTQVCEMLVRRVAARVRRLHIKIWHLPHTDVLKSLNAVMQSGLILER